MVPFVTTVHGNTDASIQGGGKDTYKHLLTLVNDDLGTSI